MNTGTIKQIIGPVVDVYFPEKLPDIHSALTVTHDKKEIVLEVAQYIGLNRVRAIAMSDTAGLPRGLEVIDTGAPISVPVGEIALGRLINVVGDAIDGKGDFPKDVKRSSIHREAPPFAEQSTKAEAFETGIKSIDLMAPFIKGGKVGFLGGGGGGKPVMMQDLTPTAPPEHGGSSVFPGGGERL